MAQYVKQEMPDLTGAGENKCYYRLQIRRNLSSSEFIKRAASHGGLNESILQHALSDLVDQLAEDLADGYSVTLDGIGTFRASLGVREDKEMDTIDGEETKRNARSIQVTNVRYRSDKSLVNEVNLRCKLSRAGVGRVNRSPYSKDERLAMAQGYLAEHPVLRVKTYAELVHISPSSASKELRLFASNSASGIKGDGRGNTKVYVKGNDADAAS